MDEKLTTLFQHNIKTIDVSRSANEANSSMKHVHYHDSFEIYYLIKGNRNYVVDDEYYTLTKGDIVLIKPGVMHKTAGGAFDRLLINFTEPYLDKFFSPRAKEMLLSCFDDTIITVPSDMRSVIRDLFDEISSLINTGKEDLTFVVLSNLLDKLNKIREQSVLSGDKITEDGKTITSILHYINKNYAEIENISQIADKFFITKYHLCRVFKKATNISVIEYLNRIKIKEACSLLENTDKTITDICTDCGFNSSVYFCKLFKKLMDMTPSQYRKRIDKIVP